MHRYQHGDLVRILTDNSNQVAVVDYQSTLTGMIYIFDPLENHTSTAFFENEVESLTETEQ